MLLLIISICFVFSGCSRSNTVWSAQSTSPDGRVIVNARATEENAGLSIISGVDTNVYINWVDDKRPPTLILSISDVTDAPKDTSVTMTWLSAKDLQLNYAGKHDLDFQAVRWADIQISVRQLPSNSTNNSDQ